jgi:hypothetical protein
LVKAHPVLFRRPIEPEWDDNNIQHSSIRGVVAGSYREQSSHQQVTTNNVLI